MTEYWRILQTSEYNEFCELFREETAMGVSAPRILVREKSLTLLLAKDDEQYCAYCPELDLVTEMSSVEDAIADLLEAIRDYAEEYLQDLDVYSQSPNRAHHLPYVQAVASCQTDWDLRALIEIKHGYVHL